MYTCIAGFVEHAESVEAAASREVEEETGVRCGPVAIVASQPWPCGRGSHCELMLACAARAIPGGEAIGLGEDARAELEDARWFTRPEVLEMLASEAGRGPALWVPPPFAIANRMISRWAGGHLAWPKLDAAHFDATMSAL